MVLLELVFQLILMKYGELTKKWLLNTTPTKTLLRHPCFRLSNVRMKSSPWVVLPMRHTPQLRLRPVRHHPQRNPVNSKLETRNHLCMVVESSRVVAINLRRSPGRVLRSMQDMQTLVGEMVRGVRSSKPMDGQEDLESRKRLEAAEEQQQLEIIPLMQAGRIICRHRRGDMLREEYQTQAIRKKDPLLLCAVKWKQENEKPDDGRKLKPQQPALLSVDITKLHLALGRRKTLPPRTIALMTTLHLVSHPVRSRRVVLGMPGRRNQPQLVLRLDLSLPLKVWWYLQSIFILWKFHGIR
mmetsp:Transcript_12214/g.18473  ORF Transcript_12214/g.18473 Transcript_12214/m.18473 type:complete len:298 (+) Transcript_12214:419-1312(+)